MSSIDFKNDVDGFAFKNDWTFNQSERDQIRQIIDDLLPAAAAILAPVLAVASPIVVATAAPFLGLAAPILPLLPLLAPVFAEKIVSAVADQVAGGENEGNLCGGMASACVDYYRLNWIVPRGNASTDTPQSLADGGTVASDRLRTRIWQGQLDSHRNDTPTFVAWTAIGLFLGDMGLEWLRDRTREELLKIDAALAAGKAVPVGLVLRADKPFKGHVVVATGLTWYGPDHCRVAIYDNEKPDELVAYGIDTSGDSALVNRVGDDRQFRALFCATYQPQMPRPAVILAVPLTTDCGAFVSQSTPINASFTMLNDGFGDLRDIRGALGNGDALVAAQPVTYDTDGTAELAPLTWQSQDAVTIQTYLREPGMYGLVPMAILSSILTPGIVRRRLPLAGGAVFIPPPLRVNPVIRISIEGARPGFGCQRPHTEGEMVTLVADLAPVANRGIQTIQWSVAGVLTQAGTSPTSQLQLPAAHTVLQVNVTVFLGDATQAIGRLDLRPVTNQEADRIEQLCQISHIVSHAPLSHIPFGPATDPLRRAEVLSALEHAIDPERVLAMINGGLQSLKRMR